MRSVLIVLFAGMVFSACRSVPSAGLDVRYGTQGYFVLHVPSKEDPSKEETYGLRRADMYSGNSAEPARWLAFWGDDPPSPRQGGYRVLKNPWLLRSKGGVWEVLGVPHRLDPAGGEARRLKAIRSGPEGDPELLYATESGTEHVERPSGWRRIERVRFLPAYEDEKR